MTDAETASTRAIEFLKAKAKSAPWGSYGLNQLPYVLFDAVAEVMVEFAVGKVAETLANIDRPIDWPIDSGKAIESLKQRIRTNTAHPSHVWRGGAANLCLRCAEYRTSVEAWFGCDQSKIANKTESCCECGRDYPHADLLAGEIFCAACRKER